jgi:hypothetical protein
LHVSRMYLSVIFRGCGVLFEAFGQGFGEYPLNMKALSFRAP